MIAHIKPSSGAHVGANTSVSHIMWQVMLAISPATAFGLLMFWLARVEPVCYHRVIGSSF